MERCSGRHQTNDGHTCTKGLLYVHMYQKDLILYRISNRFIKLEYRPVYKTLIVLIILNNVHHYELFTNTCRDSVQETCVHGNSTVTNH